MQLRSVFLVLSLAALSAATAAADAPSAARFDSAELGALARQVPLGGTLRLEGVDLRGTKRLATLVLERFRVFTRDARIVVHGEAGETLLPVPENAYFRGSIEGEPGSSVFLTALAGGALRGIAASGGEYWVMATETGLHSSPGLVLRQIDATTELAEEISEFSCGADGLGAFGGAQLLDELAGVKAAAAEAARAEAATVEKVAAKATASYTARVAVETDYELFLKFGSATAAADYVGDLFAYMSGIYSAEVDTTLLISHLSLWSTSADPWTQASVDCGLFEFGRYWNDNRGNVERTIAHFLSGKGGGGIAWLGVLCEGGFPVAGISCPGLPSTGNYGGAYGYTSSIAGSFDIDNPSPVWDVVAVSHEIGHNFNSPHTHCYGGLGGNSEPVDECHNIACGGSGCFCGTPSLPCGQTGAGCGTIMSYCHLLFSGGLGNIALTFGANHPYGVEPDRVPSRMRDHVVSEASFNPSCLAFEEPSGIFADGFESGTTSAWTTE